MDATKIFGGPGATLYIDTDSGFGSTEDLGYFEECEFTFEPVAVPTSSGQQFHQRTLCKFRAVLQQTNDTVLGYLKAARTAAQYIQVTDIDGNAFETQVAMLLTYKPMLPFNQNDVHKFEVTGQIQVQDADDFLDFLA